MREIYSKLIRNIPELSLSQFKVAFWKNLGLESCLTADLFQFLLIHRVHMLLRTVFKLLRPCSHCTV